MAIDMSRHERRPCLAPTTETELWLAAQPDAAGALDLSGGHRFTPRGMSGAASASRATVDAVVELSDAARRGLAEILVMTSDVGLPMWECGVPMWARACMAKALLLPALPLPPPRDVEGRVVLPKGLVAAGGEDLELGWADLGNWAGILEATANFRGPYAFATPRDLYDAGTLRDDLRQRRRRLPGKLGLISPLDMGFRLLVGLIDLSSAPAYFPGYAMSLPVTKSHASAARWTPGMAPWALALAHGCGGLAPEATLAAPAPVSGYARTPYFLFRRAVHQSDAFAHAMLDVPFDDPRAVDVDNSRQEPEFAPGETMDYSASDSWRLPAAIARGETTDVSGRCNVLHLVISKSVPDLHLFRRLVHRCSSSSLNANCPVRGKPLQFVLRYCTKLSEGEDVRISSELAVALLERADPDGGGVDLSACHWTDAAMRALTAPVVDAYVRAVKRQATYRAGLLPSLCAAMNCRRQAYPFANCSPLSRPTFCIRTSISHYYRHHIASQSTTHKSRDQPFPSAGRNPSFQIAATSVS
jgi:hypothetical protein